MNAYVHCLNSFTYKNTGGNPAGVVLQNIKAANTELTSQQMQGIAKRVGYSETAFVTEDKICDFNVRFFTPIQEVDFCGHATLAVFSLLFQQKLITAKTYSQQTRAGKLKVSVEPSGYVTMQQSLPKFIGIVPSAELAQLLNIDQQVFTSTNLPCEIISTGLADIIVPIPFGLLDDIVPNNQEITAFSQKYKVVGLHLFELNPLDAKLTSKDNKFTASCRNFAPLFGINEESATGSASGALACYLAKHNIVGNVQSNGTYHYTFEQGRAMKCQSKLSAKITLKKETIIQVQVGGFAHLDKTVQLEIN